ncbi:DUF4185 domain-containing protein [Nocardia bovistercoris]|uniref:DUF4185 domain-containing protein n=1 Tax=Nocardia bovistercoris TaxID=2785916 RepID=A0A931IJP1_9NOCA|nr:DUF4185 domain-containing protein [Nocardia bovistercoris]MBH0781232.1 DUF4185 domain-containing protein [Nocardia bovistercoris]
MGLLLRNLESPALVGVALLGALSLPAPSAHAGPAPWAPPPVNVCGEVGFDPLVRKPDPNAPLPPPIQIPPQIDIPIPWPEITPVPPDPAQDNTRIVPEPLPIDPCHNPCPDVRDSQKPDKPDKTESAVAPDTGSGSGSSSGSGSGSGSSSGSGSGSGSSSGSGSGSNSGSGTFALPKITVRPDIEPIPIPIPGEAGDPPQPAPPRVTPASEPGPVAEAVTRPHVESVELVKQITGHGSENRTDMRWQVDGTDLGLMWETEPGKVAVVFGDTFGAGWEYGGADGPDWRSNVLAFSSDADLSDGLTIDTMVQDSRCHAAEFLASRKIKNWETTVIPTSGFAIGKRQYLSYMSVNHWGRVPGTWSTNYGGIAWSDDGGNTWVKDQHAKWDNFFGTGRFQVTAMVPHGDHVYMFGTPNGRVGVTALARVPGKDVLNKSAYQYWVDGRWAPAAESRATPLFFGIASELSVRHDAGSDRWQMVYLDPVRGAIMLREAPTPQGLWTDAVPLVETADYPKAYGGFIHPWSTSKDLYFTVSAWDTYNVYLMRAKLREPR